MISLHQKEKMIKKIHRHWIVIFGKAIAVVVMLALPAAGLVYLSGLNLKFDFIMPLAIYAVSIFVFLLSVLAFIGWVDYWLDVWIVTDERIIDIEQIGMFRHELSEFGLDKVQDVTVEIPGFIATFLRYGKLIIHTAGERSFEINDLPNPHLVKDLILKCAKECRERNHNNGVV